VSPAVTSRLHGLPERIQAVRIDGELESEALVALEVEIEAAIWRGDLGVVVDLRGATFVGSDIVNALFRVCRMLRPAGGALAIVCTEPTALRVIEVTGLAQAVPVCGELDDAVRAVEPHRAGFR
jgi:anti-sigma B factor antagonist